MGLFICGGCVSREWNVWACLFAGCVCVSREWSVWACLFV